MVDVCLIVEGTYPYAVGGVSKWVHTLVNGLNDLNFSIVHLYAGDDPGAPVFQIPRNVIDVFEINIQNGLGYRFDFSDVVDKVPDARIYHSLSTGFSGLLGLQLKNYKNCVFILTEHGIYWRELEHGVNEIECGFKIIKNEEKKRRLCSARRELCGVFKNIARMCYLNADFVTTVCKYNLKKQMSLLGRDEALRFKSKCKVINNFVDLKSGFGFRCSSKDVCYAGRVVSIKDVKTLIKAVPLVLERMNDVRFFIVGDTSQDGEYFRECVDLAYELGVIDNVIFAGNSDVSMYYAGCGVFVLPSLSEAQPFALLEAMSFGLPVVATCVGGVPELVVGSGAKCGFCFRPGDHKKLSELIVKILTNPELKYRLSSNAVKVSSKFTVEKFLKEYRGVYERFLS